MKNNFIAYDLTNSNSLGGEHATCINGNASNPSIHLKLMNCPLID